MKKSPRQTKEKNLIQSPNFAAVLAIVTEMTRHLRQNISKVQLKPIDGVLVSAGSSEQLKASNV
jgi:hypothetical protein